MTVFALIVLGTLFFWSFRLGIAFLGLAALLIFNVLDVSGFVQSSALEVILFLVGMMIAALGTMGLVAPGSLVRFVSVAWQTRAGLYTAIALRLVLGVALIGAFLGFSLYPDGVRSFELSDWSPTVPVRGLSFLGRHSLIIYLVHQPILMGLLILLGIGSI